MNHPANGASSLPDFMSWLVQRSDLRFVCCYLTDEGIERDFANAFSNLTKPDQAAGENFDHGRHWVINVSPLRSAGWFVLPLFFDYNWPNSTKYTPTARVGLIHARMAKFLALRQGFAPGSVLYVDDEASARDLSADELTYFTAYFTELARKGPVQFPDPTAPSAPSLAYRPGYYGHNGTAAQLLVVCPELCVWSDDFRTHGRYAVPGSGDTAADRLPLSALDRAAIAPADLARTPMTTTYPADIDARVRPIEGKRRTKPAQIPGRLWPVLLQRWWTRKPTLPATAPASDPAWPPRGRPVSSWDFNESLSRDPSNPTAHVRVGACRLGSVAYFGEVFPQDPVYRAGAQPIEGVRGDVLVNSFPLTGAVGQCLEGGDGRPQGGARWAGPYVHPFSPVAGADGSPALVFVTTTGRLALFHPPTRTLRMLAAVDRSGGAAASTDPWAVRLPHAIAIVPDTPTSATIVWVGNDQRLWRAAAPLPTGDIASPSTVRDDLFVHPAARVAAVRSGQGALIVSVLPNGELFRTDLGGGALTTLGTVLGGGPVAAAISATGNAVVVAQLRDHRLAVAGLVGSRWSALTPLLQPPTPALVQPLAGIAAIADATGFRLAAPASDLKLYEWAVSPAGGVAAPAALSPVGMPPIHPFSDLAAVSFTGSTMYACARCDGEAGPVAVSATRVQTL